MQAITNSSWYLFFVTANLDVNFQVIITCANINTYVWIVGGSLLNPSISVEDEG